MIKPKAVLISDIHFTPGTLEIATAALYQAITTALELGVPLIIAGDTLDSKALIRAECANRLLQIFADTKDILETHMLVGNHDLINEKSSEHSLNFLKPYVNVIDSMQWIGEGLALVSYVGDADRLREILRRPGFTPGSTLIMHQGVQTAFMGHYVQDKTSLPPEAFKDFRVISGHYHRAQNIECGSEKTPSWGQPGNFSYIGNPYSLSFGEAHDGPKGFQILNSDNTLTLVPTNLRKHVIIETDMHGLIKNGLGREDVRTGDLVWLKVSGSYMDLENLKKKDIAAKLFGGDENFKLDKIYTDSPELQDEKAETFTGEQIIDALIDDAEQDDDEKAYLKILWREVTS